MYLISAYFDEKSNKYLQKYIEKVALATGSTFMVDNNVPPHLTLSAIEAKSPDVLLPEFESLAGELKAGNISIVSVGQFMPRVVYVAPFLNGYLLDFQTSIYEKYRDVPETTVSKLYRPLSWLPHITMGKTLSKEQMLKAVDVMSDFKLFDATITRVGLSEVNPHRVVREISL